MHGNRKTCGVGPGLVFAKALLRTRSDVHRIALVPCAVGGTSIDEWQPTGALYQNMVSFDSLTWVSN
jgi:hypothetical protein